MANRFAFRLRYVLFIAWLVSCGAPEIGVEPPNGESTPLPTLAPAPSLPPLVPPPDAQAVWSPDHKWYATTQSFCSTAVVVASDRQRVAQLPMTNSVCGQVWGWTADSRFAIFGERHPKGNDDVVVAQTYLLDALTGQVQITPGPPTSVPSATPLIVSPTPAPTRTPFLTPTP